MNQNPPKHTGTPGRPPSPTRPEDIHKQVKPPMIASAAAPKPVTAGPETTIKPSPAHGVATQAAQSEAKPAPPSKELHTSPPVTKAVTHATTEPQQSAKKATSGQTQTAASTVRPAVSAIATDGQLKSATAEKPVPSVPKNSSSNMPAAAANAGIVETRAYLPGSEQLGVMYPRATTLSEAVTGQARMSEAMLDAMQGGSVLDTTLPVEPFSKARPSIQQVRFPTPYPPTPQDSIDDQSGAGIRDVDAIEVFKRRRASISSDSDTSSVMQQIAGRHAARKSIRAKPENIDEEHLLSKGERPLRSSLRSDGGAKRKKGVKFCDADGTELAAVRIYFDQDEAPEVPLYATAYLNLDEIYNPIPEERSDQKVLRPSFSQPGAAPDFMGRVHMNKVALEFCLVSDTEMNVTGTVRVANIAFNKSVTIRYTTDQWKHTTEVKANYVYYSHDGATDRFSFVIQLPTTFGPGQQFQFAVKYEAGTETFWDNNFGQNYKVECFTREMLQLAANSSYLSSIHPTFTWLQYL